MARKAAETPPEKPAEIKTGETPPDRDSPPEDWLAKAEREAKEEQKNEPENAGAKAPDSLVDITVGAVQLAASQAAKRTGFENFRLDEEEIAWHKKAFQFLLRNVKSKDFPAVVALMMLLIIWAGKGWDYMQWRKESGQGPLFARGKPKEKTEKDASKPKPSRALHDQKIFVNRNEETVSTPADKFHRNAWF